MFQRRAPLADRITFHLDGREIEGERGEPIAVALLAAGEAVIARSPKLHRPRGPSCLRGDCDGCLARVDGEPNVMTCLRAARGGEQIVGQNVLGSRETDLLRITDWFFPRGIDHHHLMAGVPGVGSAMQSFARQMAGTGRLPDAPLALGQAARESCDVLVVGGGLAGLACVAALEGRGAAVTLVDEAPRLGGSASYAPDLAPVVEPLVERARGTAAALVGSTAVGIFDGEALIAEPSRARVIRPRALVLATGAHDPVLCVEGNDLPGVVSARALCQLASRGIIPDGSVALVGDGPWIERARALLAGLPCESYAADDLIAVLGSSRVKGIRTRSAGRRVCVVVGVKSDSAPSFQLAQQAGASTQATNAGFSIVVDGDGRAAPSVFAAGECTGTPFEPGALIESGERAARGALSLL